MKVREDRWEQGSHFHHVSEFPGTTTPPWQEARFYYSGRPAINDLLQFLSPQRQSQVWMPSHYCGDVLDPIRAAGHPIRYYDGNPVSGFDIPLSEIQAGDVLLSNCYFAVDLPSPELIAQVRSRGVTIIEDHSQDPYADLAFTSTADYAVASLRKSLPLPDGGVLWSPACLPLPQTELLTPPVFAPRLGGMLAKRLYLQGDFHDKNLFREWFNTSESDFTDAGLWGMSEYSLQALREFDVAAWRQQRAENHRLLSEAIQRDDLDVLHRGRSCESPMGLVMVLSDKEARDSMRTHLISHHIYPVVYWPHITQIPPEQARQAQAFIDRMLFLHMDARYSPDDMHRIAEVIAALPPVGQRALLVRPE